MADLVSRKPKADASDTTSTGASEIITLEYRPANEERLPDIEPSSRFKSAEVDLQEIDALAAAPDVISETVLPSDEKHSAPVDAALPGHPDKPVAPSGKGNGEDLRARARDIAPALINAASERKRRETSTPVIGKSTAAILAERETTAVPAPPKSLIEDMAELDTEVEALRRQLAQKLIEQNAQLRKMLARFEAH